jgi:hypothetical protein
MTVTPAQQHALFRIGANVDSFLSVTQSEGNVTVVIPGGMYPHVRITINTEGKVTEVAGRRDTADEAPSDDWVDLRETRRASHYSEWVESIAKSVAAANRWLPQLDAPTLTKGAADVLEAIPGDAVLALTDPDRALTVAAVAANGSVVEASAKALNQLLRDASRSLQLPAWYLLAPNKRAQHLEDARVILAAIATTGNPFVANLPLAGPPSPKQAAAVVKVFAKYWAKRA